MPITTSCPGCKALFRLAEELAGKQVRCQKCERMFMVPLLGVASAAAPAHGEPLAQPPTIAPSSAPETLPSVASARVNEPILVAPHPENPPAVKPAPAPDAPPSRVWLVVAIVLFLLGMLATGGFASVWVATHLSAPARSMVVAPFRGTNRDGFERRPFDAGRENIRNDDRRDEFKDRDKKAERQIEPTDIGIDGRADVHGFLNWAPANVGRFGNDGPFRLYRIHLVEGESYNVFISSQESATRVQIHDPDEMVATRVGTQTSRRTLLNYRPRRTGAHLLFITSQGNIVCNFHLKIAPEAPRAPARLAAQPRDVSADQLFVHDPIDAQVRFNGGPYREYLVTLEAGKQYALDLHAGNFPPVLRIYNRDNNLVADYRAEAGLTWLERTFTPPIAGDYRLRVMSEDFGLGPYTLTVARK